MADRSTFETTYVRYDFSELVRLGVALAGFIRRLRVDRSGRQDGRPLPSGHAHA